MRKRCIVGVRSGGKVGVGVEESSSMMLLFMLLQCFVSYRLEWYRAFV